MKNPVVVGVTAGVRVECNDYVVARVIPYLGRWAERSLCRLRSSSDRIGGGGCSLTFLSSISVMGLHVITGTAGWYLGRFWSRAQAA